MSTDLKPVLVTGGAGYIGSHTVLELLEAGEYRPVVVDNMDNSSAESLLRIEKLTGKKVEFHQLDLLNLDGLREVFRKYKFYAVIHFAGLKAVGESMEIPLKYYRVNLDIAIGLLEVMKEFGVKNLIFSSSACVYGRPQMLPMDEQHPVGGCSNVYGRTKFFVEEIMKDVCAAEEDWNIIILRFFNPVGAHKSGQIGEDPWGVPNNLMPFICQVCSGRRKELSIFGSDYDTRDGTGVRDYIHIVDLAQGHVAALPLLEKQCGLKVYNLGAGKGVTVLELVQAMEKASGLKIPYKIVGRRAGDVPEMFSDATLAEKELNWKATLGLEEMCADAWRWQSRNPNGYIPN